MDIVTTYTAVPCNRTRVVVALGNFDGVHCGHQHVIERAIAKAQKRGVPAGVLTFNPHPREVLNPAKTPFHLADRETCLQQFAKLGVDVTFLLPFTKEFCAMPAEEFVREVLIEGLQVSGVVVGYDFLFGHQRQGNTKMLKHLGEQYDFSVEIVDAVYADGEHLYSSSAIRHALREGDVTAAAKGLGRPWEIHGVVIKGDQRGRQLGFPTANISWGNYVMLRYGVYAVRVQLSDREGWHPAVANFGIRPTVDGGTTPLLEVHLLGMSGIDLYGQRLAIQFHHFIRPEQKFDSLQLLQEQIERDCGVAGASLRACPKTNA
jgi:riboflavin kinase/FMN adenylyltransferase